MGILLREATAKNRIWRLRVRRDRYPLRILTSVGMSAARRLRHGAVEKGREKRKDYSHHLTFYPAQEGGRQ